MPEAGESTQPWKSLRAALDAVVSLVLPAPCRLCGEVLTNASRLPICAPCLAGLPRLPQRQCGQCGRVLHSLHAVAQEPLRCGVCRRGLYAFDFCRSFCVYEGPAVRAILLLKYHELRPLGGWFAERLAEVMAGEPEAFAADVVVPVPLHTQRLRERGYNQAELIARPLARCLRLPLRSYLLARTRPRPEKLRLTRRERWLTVRGAYEMRGPGRIDNMRVLLVDDVLTTGATLDACARALKQAGAARVTAVTVARVVAAWRTPGAPEGLERPGP